MPATARKIEPSLFPRPATDPFVDDYYEEYTVIFEGVSEMRSGVLDLTDLEQRFFDEGEQLLDVARAHAAELREILDEADRHARRR